METRKIGALDVSVVGLGCNNFGWNIDEDATKQVVDAALEAGVNFFDTADIYGGTKSEEFLGSVLKGRWDKVILATKFGAKIDDARPGGGRPQYVRQAVEDSLRRLQTDRIDLYQIHTPDNDTPIADTLGALNDLVTAGKVREIGCSNFSAAQLREAETATQSGAQFVSVQNEYSLLHREPEAEVLPECEKLGIGFLPYFPLASGLLTGKYRQGQPLPEGTRIKNEGRFSGLLTDQNLATVEALISFAETRNYTILELAFSWLIRQQAVVSVIAGATSASQIQANASAAEWHLSGEELKEIETILNGHDLS
jgi:aryl-alcohol dehydrogenase-like predicted oxidoreductase